MEHYTLPHPTIIKKMKTYIELEGKLGPKPQSQLNQFRPPLPSTNPQVRKDSKVTEKGKRLTPAKKYKVKVVAWPDPSNMTMQMPQANVKTPVDPESQKPPTSENNPHLYKMSLFVQVLPGPSLGRCLAIFLK